MVRGLSHRGRKLLAMLLTVAMVLGMNSVAFATGADGSVSTDSAGYDGVSESGDTYGTGLPETTAEPDGGVAQAEEDRAGAAESEAETAASPETTGDVAEETSADDILDDDSEEASVDAIPSDDSEGVSDDIIASESENAVERYDGAESLPAEAVAINEANFPDENFRNAIINNRALRDAYWDIISVSRLADGTPYLTQDDINRVYSISLSEYNVGYIYNLEGIENFKNASEITLRDQENLTEFPAGITWSNLKYLHISDTAISSIDLSKMPNLLSLDADDTQLTSIDISKNTKLTEINISKSDIESIDISKCTLLESLNISGTKIHDLDVLNNSKLRYIDADGCVFDNGTIEGLEGLNELGYLYLADTNIRNLTIASNALREVEVQENRELESIDIEGGFIHLVQAINCTSLKSVRINRTGIAPKDDTWSDEEVTYSFLGCTALKEVKIHNKSANIKALGYNFLGVMTEFEEGKFSIDTTVAKDAAEDEGLSISCTEGSWIARNIKEATVRDDRPKKMYLTPTSIDSAYVGEEYEVLPEPYTSSVREDGKIYYELVGTLVGPDGKTHNLTIPDSGVTVKTSNAKVAAVSDNKITIVGLGTANITVTAKKNTSVSKVVKIAVYNKVTSVSLDKSEYEAAPGTTVTVKATVKPEENSIGNVWWHVYDSHGNAVTTPDGISITSGTPQKGVTTANITVGTGKISAQNLKIQADAIGNYDADGKIISGEGKLIIADIFDGIQSILVNGAKKIAATVKDDGSGYTSSRKLEGTVTVDGIGTENGWVYPRITPSVSANILDVTSGLSFEGASGGSATWSYAFPIKGTEVGKETVTFAIKKNGERIQTVYDNGTTAPDQDINKSSAYSETASIDVEVTAGFSDGMLENIRAIGGDGAAGHILLDSCTTPMTGDIKLVDDGKITVDGKLIGEWKLTGSQAVKVGTDGVLQYFPAEFLPGAKYKGVGKIEDVLPIAVAKVKSVKPVVDGGNNALLKKGDSLTLAPSYVISGYDDETIQGLIKDEFEYVYTDSSKGAVTLDEVTGSSEKKKLTLTGDVTKTAKDTVTLTMTSKNNKNNKAMSGTISVTLSPDYAERIILTDGTEAAGMAHNAELDGDSASVSAALSDVTAIEKPADRIVVVRAVPKTVSDDEVKNTVLKWTSSDTNVVKVKADATGREGTLTFTGKAGSAVVIVKANDAGAVSKSIKIDVKDTAPVIEAAAITVNKYTTGVELPMHAQGGNAIKAVNFVEGTESKANDGTYSIAWDDVKNKCIVKVLNSINITKKSTVKKTIEVTTVDGNKHTFKNIGITSELSTIKSTKQTKKANIFYNENAVEEDKPISEITLTSNYKITDVEVTGEPVTGPRVEKSSFDGSTGIVKLKYLGVSDNDAVKALKKKDVKLTVTTEGNSAEPVTVKNVQAVVTPVSLKAYPVEYVYKTDDDVKYVQLYDAKSKKDFSLTNNATVTPVLGKKDTSVKYDGVDSNPGRPGFRYKGSAKKTFKATVREKAWTQDVTVTGITLTPIKDRQIVLGTSKLTLNKAATIQKNGYSKIGVSIKNNADIKVNSISYTPDKKTKVLMDSGYLKIAYDADNQEIWLGVNGNADDVPKDGTYSLTLMGTDNTELKSKTAKLSIVLTGKDAAVTLKSKGSINLTDRDGTSVVFTPKIANSAATLAGFTLSGEYTRLFNAKYDGATGSIEVKAVDGMPIQTTTYKMGGTFLLSDGSEIEWDGVSKGKFLSVKPKSTNPKMAYTLAGTTLYKTQAGGDRKATVTFKTTPDTGVASVTYVAAANADYFEVEPVKDEGKITGATAALKADCAGLKPGTYKLKLNIAFKDAAVGAKPVTYTMNVVVK